MARSRRKYRRIDLESHTFLNGSNRHTTDQNYRWELQMFIDGKRQGKSFDLHQLGFPVTIGRDPARTKVHVGGPGTQHVSRVHIELRETQKLNQSAGRLCLVCLSANGTLVNGKFLAKNCTAIIMDGCSFALGDISSREDIGTTNRAVSFRLKRAFDAVKEKNYPTNSGTVLPLRSTFRNVDTAICISDSEEESNEKPMSSINDTIGGNPGIKQGTSPEEDLVCIFSDDPEGDLSPIGTSVENQPRRQIASEFEEFDEVATFEEAPIEGSIGTVEADLCESASTLVVPLTCAGTNMQTSTPLFTLNIDRENAARDHDLATIRHDQLGRRSPSFCRFPSNSPNVLGDVNPCFANFRHCLLNLRLDSRPEEAQENQRKFVDLIKRYGSLPPTAFVLSRLLFCGLCLEACARIGSAFKQREGNPQGSLLASGIVAQSQVSKGVLRLQLIAACQNGKAAPLNDWSVVLVHLKCIRLGGQRLRYRRLLGLVHKYERKDRRNRSGTVAVPYILKEAESELDVVDEIHVDLNARDLHGLQLQADHLVNIEQLCELIELRRCLLLRHLSLFHYKFLLGPRTAAEVESTVWAPEKVAEVSTPSLLRILDAIERSPSLSREQIVIVSAAVAFGLSVPGRVEAAVKAMLVEGPAGSGKTFVLQQVAMQMVLTKPENPVLIFSSWPEAADRLALQLCDLLGSETSRRFCVTRLGRSRDPAVIPLTLSKRIEHAHSRDNSKSLNQLKASVAETEELIQGLRASLEDQLSHLGPALKKKKLQEIALYEEVLRKKKDKLFRSEKRLCKEDALNPQLATDRRSRILRQTHIFVGAHRDIEDSMIGAAFERECKGQFSLILVDRSEELTVADLVPIMQLSPNKIVFFGDRAQSSFGSPIHPVIRDADIFKESLFKRMMSICPGKAFLLQDQWRLPNPLAQIIGDIFYKGRLPPRQRRAVIARDYSGSDHLASLTVIDVTNDGVLPTNHLPSSAIEIIRSVVGALAPCCRSIRVSVPDHEWDSVRSEIILPESLRSRCEVKVGSPDYISHLSEPEVLVLPLFCEGFVKHLLVEDPRMLCTIVTRPKTSLVVIGYLEAACEDVENIRQLVERAKNLNRYIRESPSWFLGNEAQDLLPYFME